MWSETLMPGAQGPDASDGKQIPRWRS